MLHIAQFVHRYPPAFGGAESYVERLSRHLAACGDAVTVWTTAAIELEEMWRGTRSRASFDESANPAIRRYSARSWPGRRYLLKAASLIPHRPWQCLTTPCNPIAPRMWTDAARYEGPIDVVHTAAFPYSFPIACGLRLARRRRVPFLITPFLHQGDDRTRRQYSAPHLRWLLHRADLIFVQTELEREFVRTLGVLPERIVLTGLGVDSKECAGGDRDGFRRRYQLAEDEIVIGHLANASIEKGTVDLLRACEPLWAKGLHIRIVLAGPEMPIFRSFWDRFNVKDRVVRLGVLTDEERRDFYAGIDLFALPSRSDSFGLVLLEAWANAKPNIVYGAGGPGELVRDGNDGLHAKCGDLKDLTRQLARLVRDGSLRKKLGDAGMARIAAGEFDWCERLARVRAEMQLVRHRSHNLS